MCIFNRGSNIEAENVGRYPGKTIIALHILSNFYVFNFISASIGHFSNVEMSGFLRRSGCKVIKIFRGRSVF